ncbi:MAG TPA: tetratricopeptide repeat protein [Ideonella sp.]|jgi:Tfp pilus assembly protein PilF|nr:tetratricopeptide repeat protein [Ideonella sp.]
MKREDRPDLQLALPPEQVELALARIEHSHAFRNSPRHRALLRHLVAHALAGNLAALKETVIAIEVFGRPAASFDPKLDSIVRVEARRLRARLADYYRTPDGRQAPLRIELPVGSYVPAIAPTETTPPSPDVTRRARDLVERGEHFLRQALSKETLEQALARFDGALRESPGHAPALVGMGRAWLNLATGWYQEPAVASAYAGEALQRALEIDPDNAIAHVLLGAIRHQFEHDWPQARRSFQRALALAPEQAFVHSAYGYHLVMHGAFDEAERELLRARQLDPHYINTRQHMANLRIAQGRLEDAEAEIVAMQDIAPATMAIAGLRGAIAMFRGDAASAEAHYRRACEAMPDFPGCFIALASAQALASRGEEADGLLAATLERFADRPISPYLRAVYATRRGRPDEAFDWLARACRERDPQVMQIPHEPSFAALRADVRWPALIAGLRPMPPLKA